jgi:hypothetical protein
MKYSKVQFKTLACIAGRHEGYTGITKRSVDESKEKDGMIREIVLCDYLKRDYVRPEEYNPQRFDVRKLL